MSRVATDMIQEIQLACFLLGGDTYALDIMRIKEIIPFQKIRPVPKAPRFVQGVINLRGAVLPIVDLRERFGLPVSPDMERSQRIVITSLSGRIVGLIVDAVTEILKMPVGDIVRVPSLISRRETAYVHGIAVTEDQMVLVLNMDRILSSDEQIDMEKMKKAALETAGIEKGPLAKAAEKAAGSESAPAQEKAGKAISEEDAALLASGILGAGAELAEMPAAEAAEAIAQRVAESPDEGGEGTGALSDPGGDGETGGVSVARALSKKKTKSGRSGGKSGPARKK